MYRVEKDLLEPIRRHQYGITFGPFSSFPRNQNAGASDSYLKIQRVVPLFVNSK